MKWISMLGNFEVIPDGILFKGGQIDRVGTKPGVEVGNFISDQYYGNGTISAQIEFKETTTDFGCGLILYYHPQTGGYVSAFCRSSSSNSILL